MKLSTVHVLVELYHHWSKATYDCRLKQYIRILLLDFSNAFEHIDHIILITKLRTIYHLPEFIVAWIAAFLTDRHQHVKIRQQVSDWAHIQVGVPQGTLLGVVPFTLMVDDMPCTCPMVKYVADTTENEVCHRDSPGKMQEVADNTSQWSYDSKMSANSIKTKDMIVNFRQKHLNIPNLIIDGAVIEHVSTSKLLEVYISDDITRCVHIKEIHKRASPKQYFAILLCRFGVSAEDLYEIFTYRIRSIVEYACPVWHTKLTKNQSKYLETIQKRAMNIIKSP